MSDGGCLSNVPDGLRGLMSELDGPRTPGLPPFAEDPRALPEAVLQRVRETVAGTIQCTSPRFASLQRAIRAGRRDDHGLMRAGLAVAAAMGRGR